MFERQSRATLLRPPKGKMSIEAVRSFLKKWDKQDDILEFDVSSATVALAAEALGVEPARIAKTLAFKLGDSAVLIVAAGDAKVDNRKFKEQFETKAKMLTPEEALSFTGHAVGGICPFAVKDPAVKIYTDISLRRFDTVSPACGSSNSAIRLSCAELFEIADSQGWIDVCKDWEQEENSI